jgi:thiamine-monophosphate kinase
MTAKKRTSESQLISSFECVIAASGVEPRGLVHGVGDDAAVFRGPGTRDLVATQDVQVEGRHFEHAWLGARDLGRRLAAVNLSDVASMGARPLYGLFSLVLPPSVGGSYARRVTAGVVSHLSEYGAALIGGNISGTDGPLSCDLTLIGDCPRGKAWLRRARPGDDVVVAGSLGEAAAGLDLLRTKKAQGRTGKLVRAFTRPRPLLEVSTALAGQPGVRGAIDVSDGLSTDLIHMCEASGVGCEIDAGALPVSRALASFCKARRADPTDWILGGGEDYALILAVAPRHTDRLIRRAETRTGCKLRAVGKFTAPKGAYFVVRSGKCSRLRASGWDHLTSL